MNEKQLELIQKILDWIQIRKLCERNHLCIDRNFPSDLYEALKDEKVKGFIISGGFKIDHNNELDKFYIYFKDEK